jgi:hypothetical protein
MGIRTSAAIAALVVIGLAAPLSAQSPPEKAKDHTKVYAYKKTAPSPAPTTPARRQVQSSQNSPEHLVESAPYGTPIWWREMGSRVGGDGGAP